MKRSDHRSKSSSDGERGIDDSLGQVLHNPLHENPVDFSPPLFANSVDDLAEHRRQNFEERFRCVENIDSSNFGLQRAIESLDFERKNSHDAETRQRFLSSTIDETVLISRNLPPLINKRYIDPRKVKLLIFISEVGGVLGSFCFIVGSFYFYPEYDEEMKFCEPYDCILIGSLLFVVGSFCFFFGSVANFVKNDAASCKDIGLTINATLYCIANFLFTVGSCFFCPKLAHHHIPIGAKGFKAEYIGLGCFIFGSVVFILAPVYDMYRAHHLRNTLQISALSLAVEFVIAVMYIGGSMMYLVGSVYFVPDLFERFAVTMFVVGSFCFLGACMASPIANLFRHRQRVSKTLNRKVEQCTSPPVKSKNVTGDPLRPNRSSHDLKYPDHFAKHVLS